MFGIPKEELAESITKNSVYTLKSGMRQSVIASLMKLSTNDLEHLKMLIEIRTTDAVVSAHRRPEGAKPPPKKTKQMA